MRCWVHRLAWVGAVVMFSAGVSFAQTVPGAADSSRIEQLTPITPPERHDDSALPEVKPTAVLAAPAGSEQVRFTLRGLNIRGSTVFSEADLAALYGDRLNREVTLAEIYDIANSIHTKYAEGGYFLTQVTVPDQSIREGVVTIAVVEGYIEQVTLNDPLASHSVVAGYMARIRDERPLKSATLESTLLRLNDLPGQRFQAVLSASPSGAPGASMLTLIPKSTEISGSVGFDNYGSRFLGPNQANASVSGSVAPLQQTTAYGLISIPTRELGYATIRHAATVMPDVTVQAEAGITRAHPGYTLAPLDIDSTSTSVNLSARYQWVRQRTENMAVSLSLEGKNVRSDVANTPLTRERVRVARATVNYDVVDAWKGSNVANLTLSQGIDGLGASDAGDLNLSRSEAKPEFAKVEMTFSRLQELDRNWSALVQVSAQWASAPLYSSEELGYGGQSFGRAYDTSEIVGDQGVLGALELRYGGWRTLEPVNLEPYVYYDFGVVTNKDSGQHARDAATSAGVGVRFATGWGQSGNLGLAVPLTREALAPIYGANPSSPRLMLQISQSF